MALTAALLHPWGQMIPHRFPLIAGRRIPRLLLLTPAVLGSVTLTLYGAVLIMLAPLARLDVIAVSEHPEPFTADGLAWMVLFGGFTFAGLGLSWLVAARSYLARTTPHCAI